jgi:predicted ribonuclease toxin of YeeF-YezG toxin-antitoxin module
MDVWATHNIDNYVSRGANTPTIALTKTQHAATTDVYRKWLFEKTGKEVGGHVDWSKVSPQEMQQLTESMFDAASVPEAARREYYRAFHQYIYRGD